MGGTGPALQDDVARCAGSRWRLDEAPESCHDRLVLLSRPQRLRMAQQPAPKDSAKKTAVPADARPPKGMCRVWIDGVPAAQQPAATDCPTAVKNRPNNGRVIFGDDYRGFVEDEDRPTRRSFRRTSKDSPA